MQIVWHISDDYVEVMLCRGAKAVFTWSLICSSDKPTFSVLQSHIRSNKPGWAFLPHGCRWTSDIQHVLSQNLGKKTCSTLGVFSFNIKPHSSWVHVVYSFSFQANSIMLIINLSFFCFDFPWDHSVLSHALLSDQQSWQACLGYWLPRNSVNTVRKWCSPTLTRLRKRSPHSNIGLAQWWATQPWHRPGL